MPEGHKCLRVRSCGTFCPGRHCLHVYRGLGRVSLGVSAWPVGHGAGGRVSGLQPKAQGFLMKRGQGTGPCVLFVFYDPIKELIISKDHIQHVEVSTCVPHLWAASVHFRLWAHPGRALTGASRHVEAWTWEGACSQALPSCSQPPALSQLVSLHLGRSHFLWKEPAVLSWLEENVREVLQAVDAGDPAVEECESR